MADLAVDRFLAGARVLYAVPTAEQLETFWFEVLRALNPVIDINGFYLHGGMHLIEKVGTKQRIRAKTAWNADTLRGDYADLLILDEWQLMDETAWGLVGAPMLLDNNGDAVFIYTPPSLGTRTISRAKDLQHAGKMYKMAKADTSGRWEAFHWTSHDNPFISSEALEGITWDMTSLAIMQEIMAEEMDEVPGALWHRMLIEEHRVDKAPDNLTRVVVGVDPPGGATECGIVSVGKSPDGHYYVQKDKSVRASPNAWATAAIMLYNAEQADRIVGEANYGGDMVENTLRTVAKNMNQEISYANVHATRGKAIRAEPVVAMYEQGRVHHVGLREPLEALETEMVSWIPGSSGNSPNRVDALVWAVTDLMRFGLEVGEAVRGGQKERSMIDRMGGW